MKYLNIIYNSFLWALVIAITSFKSEWLEMRINIGYIFFVTFIFLSVILSLIPRRKQLKLSGVFTTANLFICTIYAMALYGFQRLKTVPASIIREGIHINKIQFSVINLVLLIIIILGLVLIIIFDKSKQKKYK
ncbi:hypothetical protein LGL55_20955 [Clostridium tagluense]|uniref:hypothetical protein n=1 Tax=Clostridium tagluense TaxID=360422 RepID=UPI001CF4AECE|nr:hypothetical protein [Clostridium tagluense]MCB2313525.1 hypothetical protein [Clostridium tagluense]MCB2318419.1 hypothetical protein [Clostridium tagluense]MCB2323220.1 hypothetical protein [Clostridium tagluense]MCB2328133.1 hypothetical protein [Clostridium tagluense]MCB2332892.1 hypothetical protein [Clostridium tagluense]